MAGLVRMMNVMLRTVKHVGNLLGGNNGSPKKKKNLCIVRFLVKP